MKLNFLIVALLVFLTLHSCKESENRTILHENINEEFKTKNLPENSNLWKSGSIRKDDSLFYSAFRGNENTDLRPGVHLDLIVSVDRIKDKDFNPSYVFHLRNKLRKAIVSFRFVYSFDEPEKLVERIVKKRLPVRDSTTIHLTCDKDYKEGNGILLNIYLMEVVFEDGTFAQQ